MKPELTSSFTAPTKDFHSMSKSASFTKDFREIKH